MTNSCCLGVANNKLLFGSVLCNEHNTSNFHAGMNRKSSRTFLRKELNRECLILTVSQIVNFKVLITAVGNSLMHLHKSHDAMSYPSTNSTLRSYYIG